jgi:hypothetical protein
VVLNPLVWIVSIVYLFMYLTEADLITELRYAMALTWFALVVGATISVYRSAYGAGAAGQYPDARFTCLACAHEWTSEGPGTAAAQGTDAVEVTPPPEPEELEEDLAAESSADSWTTWWPVAVSFILALLVNALVILVVDRATYDGQLGGAYMGCLPVSAVILAIGAGVGARLAERSGRTSSSGAVVGVWVGAIAAIGVSLAALLGIGPGD